MVRVGIDEIAGDRQHVRLAVGNALLNHGFIEFLIRRPA